MFPSVCLYLISTRFSFHSMLSRLKIIDRTSNLFEVRLFESHQVRNYFKGSFYIISFCRQMRNLKE